MESFDERRICQEIVRQLLKERGWRLIGISEDALVSATLDDLHTQQCVLESKAIERCAARQYVAAFYAACRADGTPLQAEAFQCLGKRLARIALYKTGDEDWARDCAQRALRIIYEKLATCADPRSFFSWTSSIVLNEVYQDLRAMQRHPEESLDEVPGSGDETDIPETDARQSTIETPEDMFSQAENDVAARQLVEHVHIALGNSRQWQVVAEFYLNGRSYSEIAEMLHTTTNNVHLIMHRAIHKLRSDHQLMQELQGFLSGDDS